MIQCSKCKKLKPTSDFSNHPTKKNGLQSNCKKCSNSSIKKLRQKKTKNSFWYLRLKVKGTSLEKYTSKKDEYKIKSN